MANTVRGLRNNNPGNIEFGTFARLYGGTLEDPPLDGGRARFAKFPTMVDGLRTIAELLIVYSVKPDGKGGKIDTVAEAINRWAPSNENHTAAYIALVCTVLDCNKNDEFDFTDPNFLFWMVTGIGEEETGAQAFTENVSDTDILAGVQLALES